MLPRALDTQAASVLSRAVLVAQYGSEFLPVRSSVLRLNHFQNSTSLTHRTISPIPHCPWSHVDFVTDIPKSEGYTCILIAVDRFSKACKLIPLRDLPTALETAEALFYNLFGIPENVVSNRGLQFVSRVWKAFFKLLNVRISPPD